MRQYLLKSALLLLIAADTWIFAYLDDQAKLLDSAAWLCLLLLFEVEKNWLTKTSSSRILLVLLRMSRGVAILLILASNASYVQSSDWLDIINSLIWYGVIVRMEYLARWPVRNGRDIYLILFLPVLAWIWRSEWLDAWDAILWIIALMVVDRPDMHIGPMKAESDQCNQTRKVVPAEE